MIVATQLSKRFGSVRAVDEVSLQIAPQETLLLHGPNGSGKSTLLKLLAGLHRPTTGAVTIDGRPPLESRGRVGFAGHDSFLYPSLTVRENLNFFASLYGVDPDPSLAERIGLEHRLDFQAGALSRGEAQRASILRALLHDPDFLFLDEPFAGLDDETQQVLPALIGSRPRTTVIVSHDIGRAKAIAQSVMRMDSGRLAA